MNESTSKCDFRLERLKVKGSVPFLDFDALNHLTIKINLGRKMAGKLMY